LHLGNKERTPAPAAGRGAPAQRKKTTSPRRTRRHLDRLGEIA